MSCRAVMTVDSPTLRAGQTVLEAIRTLAQHKSQGLPVVDDRGQYVGMLRLRDLLALVLPKAVALDDREHMDLSFVQDRIGDLSERLGKIAHTPIGKYVSTDTPVVRPDTSLTETLLLLYRRRSVLPVVDPGTNRLVGVVTMLDALSRIAEE